MAVKIMWFSPCRAGPAGRRPAFGRDMLGPGRPSTSQCSRRRIRRPCSRRQSL